MPDHRDVVVGVDGSSASLQAVRYALVEAGRAGRHVRVVHAVPDEVVPFGLLPPRRVAEAGRAVLERVLRDAGPAPHGVRVTTGLLRGRASLSLVGHSRDAHIVVTGTDRRPTLTRLLTGDTTAGVAANSAPPAVVVPETWDRRRDLGLVVVGIKHPRHASGLLSEAFDLAAERGSALRVIHAWRMATAYEDLLADELLSTDWAERSRRQLDAALAPWRSAFSDVQVSLDVVNAQPAAALVEASREADEVVLLRRAHGFPSATHLGATARTVLQHADCPVRVVPPGHTRAPLDLALEADGAVVT